MAIAGLLPLMLGIINGCILAPLAEGFVQGIRAASILIATDGTRAARIGGFRGGIWLRCI